MGGQSRLRLGVGLDERNASQKGLTKFCLSGKLDPLFTIPRAVRSAEGGPASFFALLPVNPMEDRERFVRGTLIDTRGSAFPTGPGAWYSH